MMFSENKGIRISAFILFAVILIGILPIHSLAASYTTGTYVITARSGLNVRSGPGTGFKTVTAIPYNKSVEVTKISGSWGLVTYNSKTGWISMQYTQKKVTETTVNYQVKITAKSGLNMRAGAGSGYSVVTAIPKNKVVTVTKENNGWGYVSYNGKKGWIILTYTEKYKSSSSGSSSTNPFSNAFKNVTDKDVSTITKKLDNFMAGTSNLSYGSSTASAKLNTTWNNFKSSVWGYQCKGFATAVFYSLYGHNIAAAYWASYPYKLDINNDNTTIVWQKGGTGITNKLLKDNLSKAKPGDFIQMSGPYSGKQHSMIVYSVDYSGIWVYDANWDNKNTIKKHYMTWQNLYNYIYRDGSKNSRCGISLYRDK